MASFLARRTREPDVGAPAESVQRAPNRPQRIAHRFLHSLISPPLALISILLLSGLIAYLLIRQQVDPGYTSFLGYMILQNSVALIFLVGFNFWLAPERRVSTLTYILVVAEVWSDSLGNALRLYNIHREYDKVTHLLGGMAITAVAADLLLGIKYKHGKSWSYRRIILLSATISISFCVGWEVYEYFGDRLINSSRWKGWIDTRGDLIADTLGVLVVIALKMLFDPNRLLIANLNRRPLPAFGRALSVEELCATPGAVTTGWRRPGLAMRAGLSLGILAPIAVFIATAVSLMTTPVFGGLASSFARLTDRPLPNDLVIRTDLFLFGLAALIFGVCLGAIVPYWNLGVQTSLALFGGSLMLSAIVRNRVDAAGLPQGRDGFMSNWFGVLAILAILIAMFLTTVISSESTDWSQLFWPGVGGIVLIATGVALFLTNSESMHGPIERVIALTGGIWMVSAAQTALKREEAASIPAVCRSHFVRHLPT